MQRQRLCTHHFYFVVSDATCIYLGDLKKSIRNRRALKMYINSLNSGLITPYISKSWKEKTFLTLESKTWPTLLQPPKVYQDTLEEKGYAYTSTKHGAIEENWKNGRVGADDLRTMQYIFSELYFGGGSSLLPITSWSAWHAGLHIVPFSSLRNELNFWAPRPPWSQSKWDARVRCFKCTVGPSGNTKARQMHGDQTETQHLQYYKTWWNIKSATSPQPYNDLQPLACSCSRLLQLFLPQGSCCCICTSLSNVTPSSHQLMPTVASFLCAAPQMHVLYLGSLPSKHTSLTKAVLVQLFLKKTGSFSSNSMLMKAKVHQKGILSDVLFFFFRLAGMPPLFASVC